MDDFALARVVHVVTILLWIGGVAFVTLVVLPTIRHSTLPERRLAEFHRIEGRFARQARWWVLLAGASGLWMIWKADLWNRFSEAAYWWMTAMLAVWLIFFAMLFVIEPLFLHNHMDSDKAGPASFDRMLWMHRILLFASLVTTIGAVGGSHGLW